MRQAASQNPIPLEYEPDARPGTVLVAERDGILTIIIPSIALRDLAGGMTVLLALCAVAIIISAGGPPNGNLSYLARAAVVVLALALMWGLISLLQLPLHRVRIEMTATQLCWTSNGPRGTRQQNWYLFSVKNFFNGNDRVYVRSHGTFVTELVVCSTSEARLICAALRQGLETRRMAGPLIVASAERRERNDSPRWARQQIDPAHGRLCEPSDLSFVILWAQPVWASRIQCPLVLWMERW